MIAAILTLPLLVSLLALGILIPWLGLRVEAVLRVERELTRTLEVQRRLIDEQRATIEGYRELVAADANFAVAPSAPSPRRWTQLALCARTSRFLLDSVSAQQPVLSTR